MKKKTKVSKKKLDNLLLILLLTAVLLIMSTYAWFTANRTVKIDSIDVNVATSSGLQISADGITWKTILTKKDIAEAYKTYAGAVNQLPSIMSPVSSVMELDGNGHMKMFFGSVEADLTEGSATEGQYLLTSKLQSDVASDTITADDELENEYAKGYYIAFDVFLKVDTPVADLYMSGNVLDTTANSKDQIDQGVEKGLASAARVAIIKGTDTTGHTASGAATDVIQGLDTVGGTVMSWEPNYDTHNQFGVNNYEALFTTEATPRSWKEIFGINLTAAADNTILPYDGLKAEFENIPLGNALETLDPTNFARVNPSYTSKKADLPSYSMPGGLDAGITKYRIYMWVEGQDVDCENNASGTNVYYDLSFSLDPFTGTTEP